VLLRSLLEESGVRGDRLVLEVTESALIDDPRAGDVLEALNDLGVRLAGRLRDGYSSLTYLKRFPVDIVKVDRSFVAGLGRDADDQAIVARSSASPGPSARRWSPRASRPPSSSRRCAPSASTSRRASCGRAPCPGRARGLAVPRRHRARTARRSAPAPSAAPAAGDGGEERILALHRQGASLHTIAARAERRGQPHAGRPALDPPRRWRGSWPP
jgi:hypothetical protein